MKNQPESRDKYIRIELNRRQFIAILSLLILSGVALKLGSESLTMTTYYPSPVGNYLHLNAHVAQFSSYSTKNTDSGTCTYGGLAGPCMKPGQKIPTPGQFFYNGDKDAMYYTSNLADPDDQTTWLRPVSGVDSKQVGSASLAGYGVPPGWQRSYWWYGRWVHPWAAGPEKGIKTISYGGYWWLTNAWLRVPAQNTQGLYTLNVSGNYCTQGSSVTAHPTFSLYRGVLGSYWVAMAAIKADLDVSDSGNVGYAGKIYCGDFHAETLFILPKGYRQDYGMVFQPDIVHCKAGLAGQTSTKPGQACSQDTINGVTMTLTRYLAF